MSFTVSYVQDGTMRIETISFFPATSVLECGITCRFIGRLVMTWLTLLWKLGDSFINLSLLRWCLWLAGTFGRSEMLIFLKGWGPDLLLGEVLLFMICRCRLIRWSLSTRRSLFNGLLLYLSLGHDGSLCFLKSVWVFLSLVCCLLYIWVFFPLPLSSV